MVIMGKRERIFGIVILMLMAVLALSTIVFASGRNESSYSLTIHKVANLDKNDLPTGSSLKGVKCDFRVEGILKGNENPKGTPFTKEVSVTLDENGEGSAKIDLGAPGSISVIELNPNTANTLLTSHKMALTDISNESSMYVNGSNPKAEIDLSKEDSWIRISPQKAADAQSSVKRAYKITGNGKEYKKEIEDGKSDILEGLRPGHYTIEAQKAPAGFGLEVTNPCIESKAGENAVVTIDSNSGEGVLSIEDDGNTHCFRVEGPNGYSDEFVLPYYDENGNQKLSYQVQHVVAGNYTMYEDSYKGKPAFTVYAPKTTYTTQATKSYTFKAGYYTTWTTAQSVNKDDYIRLRVYDIKGPDNGKNVTVRVKGAFLKTPADGKAYVDRILTNYQPTSAYLLGDTTYTTPGEKVSFKFYDSAGVTNCKVDLRLYKPREIEYASNQGSDKIVTVDERRYIEIEKPVDNSTQADQVSYKFTILDKDGKTVTVTDDNGESQTEVKMSSGQKVRVMVPEAGNYTVHQEMQLASKIPFTVKTRCRQNTTLQNATLTASIAGKDSTIQMSKPACEEGTDDLGREYHFRVTGPSLPEGGAIVSLKSGESSTLRELLNQAGENVPEDYEKGKYLVRAIDGGYADFGLTYSDSCTLDVVSPNANVKVTNTYQKAQGTYRVVHEYYNGNVSTPDAENFDGRSSISIFGDKNLGSKHTGENVTRELFYNKDGKNYEYEYVDTVYGNYGEFVQQPESVTTSVSNDGQEDEAEQGDLNPAGTFGNASDQTDELKQNISDQADDSLIQDEDLSDGTDGQLQDDVEHEDNAPTISAEGSNRPNGEAADVSGHADNGRLQASDNNETMSNDTEKEENSGKMQDNTKKSSADLIFKDTGKYTKDDRMVCAEARPHGDNIIILRYRRVERPAVATGKYHVVHRYYHRTSVGDIFEGSCEEDVISAPIDFSKQYTVDTVKKRPKFVPEDPDGVPHTYTYEFAVYGLYEPVGEPSATEDGYHPIDGKECVYATETGKEAIVLRYYRDEAAYNIIHEYYLRTPVSAETSPAAMNPDERSGENAESNEGSDDNKAFGFDEEQGGHDAAYEYSFEGDSEVTMHTGILGDTYTGLRVKQIPQFDERQYTHFRYDYGVLNRDGGYTEDPDMESATATMRSEQLIILRYYRDVEDSVDKPVLPPGSGVVTTPPSPPDSGAGSTPEPGKDTELITFKDPKSSDAANVTKMRARTGDDRHVGLWMCLCVGSAVCFWVTLCIRRWGKSYHY